MSIPSKLALLELSKDDIIEEYEKLYGNNKNLQELQESYLQKIYELKKNLQTATNAEQFLSCELETISLVHEKNVSDANAKHQLELNEYKTKYANVQETNLSLETEINSAKTDVEELKHELHDKQEKEVTSQSEPISSLVLERLNKIEEENLELTNTLEDMREQLNAALKQIIQDEKRIDDLSDQLECITATLDTKREELEEKNQLYETAQERVFELTAELAPYKNLPETDANKRGNSLFAEVDDQRQKMKHILDAQKKHYTQMKMEYNRSEQEIRALKRENAAMHKELQVCSDIFLNADKKYKATLNERIGQVLDEKENLEKKLKWAESKLSTLANEKGMTWFDPMLTFCKNETIQLKNQLHTCRMQKSLTEGQLHIAEQDSARWRFEALQSRCLIINRETLLEENNIPFLANLPNVAKLVQSMNPNNQSPQISGNSAKIFFSSKEQKSKRKSWFSEDNKENNSSGCIKTTHKKSTDSMEVVHHEPVNTVPHVIDITIKSENIDKDEYMQVDNNFQPDHDMSTILCDTINVANEITTFIAPTGLPPSTSKKTLAPTYRNMTFTPESMAKLTKNIAKLKSSTPQFSDQKYSRNIKSITKTQKDLFPANEDKKSVNFSSSTIEGYENKLKSNSELLNNSLTSNASGTEKKSETTANKGIIRRVVVKSKKPMSSKK